jgi:hypothetical protein
VRLLVLMWRTRTKQLNVLWPALGHVYSNERQGIYLYNRLWKAVAMLDVESFIFSE